MLEEDSPAISKHSIPSNLDDDSLALSNGSWSGTALLTLNGAASDDYFGISVSMTDSYAIIGANAADNNKGTAYIYGLTGASPSSLAPSVAPSSMPSTGVIQFV